MPTPSDPVTRWSALGTPSSILSAYEPGFKEVTNLGLLFTRAFLAYDGITQSQYISPTNEKNTLYSNPSINSLSTLYNNKSYYDLPCIEKQFPGVVDSPTWTLQTDSSLEQVGRSYAGKPESLSTLEFTCPVIIPLQEALISHAAKNSVFTIIQCYDDPNQDDIYYIVTPRCTLLGINTTPAVNNSGARMKVRFKPMGGIFIPVYLNESR